jgi:hypothetical protein
MKPLDVLASTHIRRRWADAGLLRDEGEGPLEFLGQ